MKDYIQALEQEFKTHSDTAIAVKQKAYLRDQFECYGIKTTERRALQAPFLVKAYLPSKTDRDKIIKTLWQKPQREYHYFAQELMFKYIKELDKEDITLLEYMVEHKSWWDTVDFIASKLLGTYFKTYPEQIETYIDKWLKSGNIWLQRSAILFQLKYKTQMDTELLSSVIHALLGSKEFFINKAIGWVLRDYSRINPDWVKAFVDKTPLSPLSKKEALRLMEK